MTGFLVPGRILPQSWQAVWGSSLVRMCQRSTLWPLFLKQSIQWRSASPWTWQLRHTPPDIQECILSCVSKQVLISSCVLNEKLLLTDYCLFKNGIWNRILCSHLHFKQLCMFKSSNVQYAVIILKILCII